MTLMAVGRVGVLEGTCRGSRTEDERETSRRTANTTYMHGDTVVLESVDLGVDALVDVVVQEVENRVWMRSAKRHGMLSEACVPDSSRLNPTTRFAN